VRDITYCANPDCPFADCPRSVQQLTGKTLIASFADLGCVCKRFRAWRKEQGKEEQTD